jgi:hypothetical protein
VCANTYIHTYIHILGSVDDKDVEELMQERAPVDKPRAADTHDSAEDKTKILRKEPAFWAKRLIRELGEYSLFSEVCRVCVCLCVCMYVYVNVCVCV